MSRVIDDYFRLQDKYIRKYGEKTLLLHQNGKFYEVYGIVEEYDDFQNPVYSKCLQHIYENTSLNISKKSAVKFNHKQVFMAGPPTDGPAIENLKTDLTNLGFTVIIHFQDNDPNDNEIKIRTRHEIYTSAIQDISHDPILNPNQNQIANKYICCISFYPLTRLVNRKQLINVGVSFLSLLTNHSFVTYVPIYTHSSKSGWSNINTILQLYPPKEVLIYKPENISLSRLQSHIHILKNTQNFVFDVCHETAHNSRYCRGVITNVFNKQPQQIPALKQYESIMSVNHSFSKLLEKVQRQCSRLLNNLQAPTIIDTQDELFLGNDPLVQLNIISSGLFNDLSKTASARHKSLYHLLDYHKTPLGKRRFYKKLTQPVSNPEILAERFRYISLFKEAFTLAQITAFWKGLTGINDIILYHSKISKQLTQSLSLESMVMYYKQIEKIHLVSGNIKRNLGENVRQIAPWFNYEEIEEYYENLHQTFATRYDMDTYDYQNPEAIRIREGCNVIYDQAFSQINEIRDNLTCISAQLNTILSKQQKNAKVELINNDYFEITTHRYNKYLKPYISKHGNKEISLINGTRIKISEYEEVPLIKKNKIGLRYIFQNEIDLPECERVCMEEREKIKRDIYLFIQSQNNEQVAEFVATLDCLCNDIYLIEAKGYVMPILDEAGAAGAAAGAGAEEKGETPFVEIEGVSHPIISSLCEYKTNSVIFNEERRGMLLYGVNESGKSSLMKAIGMNVILAQCGMPVCCQRMRFYPYKKIYTRIQSQDNLWLGQSTFNVEIQELNNIIQGADDKTLILADELCSGTEVTSANKILLSTIIWLSRIGSHYLFTTHLHSLKRSPRLAECEGLHIYDIPIRYDAEKNELVYPRRLVEGNSEELYGVMVARANHLPDEFMDLVDSVSIAEKRQQSAKYNTQKRMDNCEVCGCGADERKLTIDHMLEQQSANENGIIDDEDNKRRVHKNHIDNLVCVCSFCHEKKTRGEISYRYEQTNNGKNLVVTRVPDATKSPSFKEQSIQMRLQEFVYSRLQSGEKEIADEFKRTYPKQKRPTLKKIRKIKELLI